MRLSLGFSRRRRATVVVVAVHSHGEGLQLAEATGDVIQGLVEFLQGGASDIPHDLAPLFIWSLDVHLQKIVRGRQRGSYRAQLHGR